MRDKNLNSLQFQAQVERFLTKKLILPKMPKTAVIDTPTFLEQYNFKLPKNFREILGLVVIHHFCPEILRWRLWLDLCDQSYSQLNNKQRIIILILLFSKESCLNYLFLTKRYSSHEIFGNILGDGLKVLRHLSFYPRSKKVQLAKRKRGYDDKGSQRPKEKWLPSYDISFTNAQNEKEKKSDLRQSTVFHVLKYLENFEKQKKI